MFVCELSIRYGRVRCKREVFVRGCVACVDLLITCEKRTANSWEGVCVCVCLCILDANDQAIRRTLGEVRRYDDSEVKWMGHQSVYLHLRTAPPNITTSTAIWRIRFYRPIRYAYMNLSRRGYDYSVLIYADADFNKLRPMLLNLYTWSTNELKLTK